MEGYLAIISAIVGILSFLIQIFNLLPQHREAGRAVLLLSLGIFVGSLLGSVRNVELRFTETIHPFLFLMLCIIALNALLLFIGGLYVVLGSQANRTEAVKEVLAGFGFGEAILILACAWIVASGEKGVRLSQDEILALANHHIKVGNFSDAEWYLRYSQQSLNPKSEEFRELALELAKVKDKKLKTLHVNLADGQTKGNRP